MKEEESKTIYPSVNLNSSGIDKVTAMAKGLLGAAPIVGPLVAEVVGVMIPNQRLDRLMRFVEILEQKVDNMDQQLLNLKMKEEQFIDLLEDGMWQASRALTDIRKEHIATLLKNSMTNEELSHLEEKIILNILGQLSDPEVIMLQSYGIFPGEALREFQQKHKDVLQGPMVYSGSGEKELDKDAIHKTYRQNLVSLNLLRARFKKPKKNELPEFDEKTGMVKASGFQITNLGRLLLKYLDLETY